MIYRRLYRTLKVVHQDSLYHYSALRILQIAQTAQTILSDLGTPLWPWIWLTEPGLPPHIRLDTVTPAALAYLPKNTTLYDQAPATGIYLVVNESPPAIRLPRNPQLLRILLWDLQPLIPGLVV